MKILTYVFFGIIISIVWKFSNDYINPEWRFLIGCVMGSALAIGVTLVVISFEKDEID